MFANSLFYFKQLINKKKTKRISIYFSYDKQTQTIMIIDNFLLPCNFIPYNNDSSKKLKVKNISVNRNNMIELILVDDLGMIITKEINNHATFLITVLTEFISKTKLWPLNFSMDRMMVGLEVILNTDYIKEYIDSSAALSMYINQCFYQKLEYEPKSNMDSYIPSPTLASRVNININFDIYKSSLKLFEYQKNSLRKMILIEKDEYPLQIDITYKKKFLLQDGTTTKVYMYPLEGTISLTDKCIISMKTRGGVLADEMGLGKTLTSLAIIGQNPSSYNELLKRNRIYSGATLIICPSHLVRQWESEIDRMYVNMKVIKVLTRTHHVNITYEDIIKADVIIISQQFLFNFKYYPIVKYDDQRFNTGGYLKSFYYFDKRMRHIIDTHPLSTLKQDINRTSSTLMRFLATVMLKEEKSPLFEHFMFRRILLDESHEIFGFNLDNNSQAQYLKLWVENLESDYKWYISGTPIINSNCLYNTLDFLDCQLKIEMGKRPRSESDDADGYIHWRKMNSFIMKKKYIMEKVLSKLIIRHKKTDEEVTREVKLAEHQQEVIWIKFTELERKLYDSKVNSLSSSHSHQYHHSSKSIELQQLCCHILVSNHHNRRFGSLNEIDLDQMQDELLNMHLNTINVYTNKLENLDPLSQAYHMLKKTYTEKISESTYMVSILKNLGIGPNNESKEECTICLDECSSDAVMTPCGHFFCKDCLQQYFDTCHKTECPNCKRKLKPNHEDIYSLKSNDNSQTQTVPLTYEETVLKKYGSKLGTLILKVREIISSDSENRVIIFSQWDVMLRLIGKTLDENNINNSFVKGNVYCRAKAIDKFKKGKDSQVIMLSLTNSASGTDFVEGSHVLFVEPIDSDIEQIRSIESQALARIHRIGKTKTIHSIRFLVENTIEEQIYKSKYVTENTPVVV